MEKGKKIYLFFASIILACFLMVLIPRFYYLQIVKHEDRLKEAEGPVKSLFVRGKRGTIYDRNGTPLAMSEPKINIAVDPNGIKGKEFAAEVISKVLSLDKKKTLSILKNNTNFRYLKKDASYDEVFALKSAVREIIAAERKIMKSKGMTKDSERDRAKQRIKDFQNIIYEEGYKRVYPQGKLLANVLGFVQANKNPEEDTPEGLEGLEMKYDKELRGKKKEIKKGGRSSNDGDDELSLENGADIYLTIDSEIQFIAEE